MAGYHMLMILSQVDGNVAPEEGQVLIQYLQDTFPFRLNLDHELEILSNLKPEEYMPHFQKCITDFYQDSNAKERNEFLDFAAKMVGADHKVTPEENVYLRELFNAWDPSHEE